LSARAVLAGFLLFPLASASADEVLALDGLPPVRIGMTLVQAEHALGKKLDFDRKDINSKYCLQAQRPGDKKTWYMLENFHVVRIDTENSAIATSDGARVGDTEASLKKRYGKRAIFSAHPYLGEDGHYVTVLYPGRKLVFETEKGKVTSWRIGLPAPASYMEGCA
jgi:hypothetical protein